PGIWLLSFWLAAVRSGLRRAGGPHFRRRDGAHLAAALRGAAFLRGSRGAAERLARSLRIDDLVADASAQGAERADDPLVQRQVQTARIAERELEGFGRAPDLHRAAV